MFLGIGLRLGMQGGGSFPPAALFASGEEGAWYDPSDLSTLFQDSAGTTPVTTAGQPVGKMLDKSGRGNHATQSTSSQRPTYQTAGGLHWLAFDGVDDAMATGTITPNVDKAQVFAGLRSLSGDQALMLEASNFSTFADGIIAVFAPISSNSYRYRSAGTNRVDVNVAGFTAPVTSVFNASSDISGNRSTVRVNGVQAATDTSDQGTGNYLANPFYIGGRGGTSLFFNGNIYGLIIRFGPNVLAAQTADTETYMAARTGVTL